MARKGKATRKAKHPSGLTAQQESFAQHYALTQNGADAYSKAYPTSQKHDSNYRSRRANELLRDSRVSSRVAHLMAKTAEVVEKKFQITAGRVLEEIVHIALQNAEDYFEWGTYERPVRRKNKETGRYEDVVDQEGNPITETVSYARPKPASALTRAQKAAILTVSESVTKTGDRVIETKMGDKLGALKLLGQHFGLFKERVEHTGKDGGPIQQSTTVTLPDISKVKDPRDALRAFEAFRMAMNDPRPPANKAN